MRNSILLAVAALLLVSGCYNNNLSTLGSVTGTVYINGKPAPKGINIEFDPVEQGVRGSNATTDASGQYEADYTLTRKGVRLGECVVKLSPPLVVPKGPRHKRKLPYPEEYYEEITRVEITSGYNTVDLEISK
ncbi:hypothetical protein AB1K70_09310 [Bremerella sp. JC770]|uniref:hypothetical protein n=1 Tax=Bremerella sp. JC770 TaxID=3232137 RepID=UPI0034582E62